MIKVLICDDVAEIRECFYNIINAQEDMHVVGVAKSGVEAVLLEKECSPDIILMDLQMETRIDGIEATRTITGNNELVKIIILTIHGGDDNVLEAYLSGACDYILKDSSDEVILSTIRHAYFSNEFLGKYVASVVKKKLVDFRKKEVSLLYMVEHLGNLTYMEKEILKDLCNKKKRTEIARSRFISDQTVKSHISHILRKLEFKTTKEMVATLNKLGIIEFLGK